MPWSARFDEPIILRDGRKLPTLRDAATYITGLPKAEQRNGRPFGRPSCTVSMPTC